MKKHFILLCMFFLMLSISCTQNDYKGLPPATGGLSELLIVLQNQKWDGSVGETIKQLFSSEQGGLNQPEPMYDLMQITHNEFKGLFEKNRKILNILISDTVKENQVVAKKDVFASRQIIVEVHAKTDQEAISLINSRFSSIVEMYKQVERERVADAFAQTENLKLRQDMIDQFGFYFIMPESFYNAKESTQFAWYRLEN